MAQQLVSFEVAKALKEAGYPQGDTPYQYVTKNYDTFKEGEVIDSFYENWVGNNVIDIPSYIDTWLWLWREKRIPIKVNFAYSWLDDKIEDPEDAIIARINYLVENDLIK